MSSLCQVTLQTIRRSELVRESEILAEEFHFRLPLSRSWHITSFQEMLESGWPVFGLLSIVGKEMAMVPQVVEYLDFQSYEEIRPLRMPLLQCNLLVEGTKISLVQKQPRDFKGMRQSTQHLLLDTDACNLLGAAASIFHQVRLELSQPQRNAKLAPFHRLVNYTAACSQATLDPNTCRQKDLRECAALGDDGKAIPLKCLKSLGCIELFSRCCQPLDCIAAIYNINV